MKKYIAVAVALFMLAGCGEKAESENATTETTEVTTEESTETEETSENTTEEETKEEETVNEASKVSEENTQAEENNSGNTDTSASFEQSEAYSELENLASGAGFELSYSDNTAVFTRYITDDTIADINEKNPEFVTKWDEDCGLYEEFCSEAMRILNGNNAGNISAVVEIVGSSDDQVYYRNENGSSIYNACSF